MSKVALICLTIVLFVLGLMYAAPIWPRDQIDCGPEGKPVPNQEACIDREPVSTTYP